VVSNTAFTASEFAPELTYKWLRGRKSLTLSARGLVPEGVSTKLEEVVHVARISDAAQPAVRGYRKN